MSTQRNSAEKIIHRFGGQTALAHLIGKRQSTVQHWAKTGRVPAHWHETLMTLARSRGIALEAKDFMQTNAPDIASASGRLGILLVGLGAVVIHPHRRRGARAARHGRACRFRHPDGHRSRGQTD